MSISSVLFDGKNAFGVIIVPGMTSSLRQEALQAALKAARAAGELIVEARDKRSFSVTHKGSVDLVTSSDIAAEKIILEIIRKRFPDHNILSEESSPELAVSETDATPLWIIDPIDGTTNYAHFHHQVGISIAYAENGSVVAGVVFSPFQDELFQAVKGGGAMLNGEPIQVSECADLRRALIGTGFPYARDEVDLLAARVKQVLLHCQDLRRLGSAALDICWIACGRLDGFYESLNAWDLAAAVLIAREAGASIDYLSDRNNNNKLPQDLWGQDILVANPMLISKLKQILIETA